MRISIMIFFILSSVVNVNAQLQTIDVNQSGIGSYGSVRVVNLETLGQKQISSINYDDFNGSPFWDTKWNVAFITLKSGAIVKAVKIKLNLYTGDMHYIDLMKGELAAEAGSIRKIIMFKGEDTTKILASFKYLIDTSSSNNYSFYRVLNAGDISLLELKKCLVKESPYDPMTGRRQKSFFTKSSYAIYKDETVLAVKSLDASTVLKIIAPASQEFENWLATNKNKLKNEKDVIKFFDYYNSKRLN